MCPLYSRKRHAASGAATQRCAHLGILSRETAKALICVVGRDDSGHPTRDCISRAECCARGGCARAGSGSCVRADRSDHACALSGSCVRAARHCDLRARTNPTEAVFEWYLRAGRTGHVHPARGQSVENARAAVESRIPTATWKGAGLQGYLAHKKTPSPRTLQ